jgi:photosystem II stability/assembly factor-like uncharacterized protein
MNFRLLARLVVALGVFLSGASYSSATQVYKGTSHDALYGLCKFGSQQLAVGDAGLVLESIDAGESWTKITPFTDNALLDISCSNGVSLIVGQEGKIYRRTVDGFTTVEGSKTVEGFTAVTSSTKERLLSVSDVSDSGLAIAVGGFGAIVRSTDAGQSWQSITMDWPTLTNDFFEPHLYDVHVSDAGIMTVVGEFELIIQSLDQGDTWQTVHLGEASLFGLSLNANGIGFAVGQNGKIITTADGGRVWREAVTSSAGILLNVWSSGSGDVLISGIRNTLQSSDNGLSWNRIDQGVLSSGWYQGLSIIDGGNSQGKSALLAGHGGNLIKLELQK